MLLSFMKAINASRGIRRNRLPGTRKPLSRPLSKQRMIVCCETLQISAASPVVNTVFMPCRSIQVRVTGHSARPVEVTESLSVLLVAQLSYLTIDAGSNQLE